MGKSNAQTRGGEAAGDGRGEEVTRGRGSGVEREEWSKRTARQTNKYPGRRNTGRQQHQLGEFEGTIGQRRWFEWGGWVEGCETDGVEMHVWDRANCTSQPPQPARHKQNPGTNKPRAAL